SGLVQRGRQATYRPGRNPEPSGPSGAQPGALGGDGTEPPGRGGRTGLRDRPGEGIGRPPEADPPEGRVPQCSRLGPRCRPRVPFPLAGTAGTFTTILPAAPPP